MWHELCHWKWVARSSSEEASDVSLAINVVDDFGYVCLDKGKRELVNIVDGSKHNAETSHTQHPKQ